MSQDQQQEEENTYECITGGIGCCLGYTRIAIPLLFCLDYPYRIITQGNEGIVSKYGRFVRKLSPGMHYYNVCTEQIDEFSKQIQLLDLSQQRIQTKDGITCTIDGTVYFQNKDTYIVKFKMEDQIETIKNFTQNVLRQICGQNNFQDLLENREKISEEIQQSCTQKGIEWGIKFNDVFINNIQIDQQLALSLSQGAQEKRIAEAKMISAQADVEVSSMMKNIGDILENKSAMQIRYLETLQAIAQCGNQKILFLPLEPGAK